MGKDLDDLIKFAYNKYPFPEAWWSKAHFEKRCIQIHTYEQVIARCMDNYKEAPKDIIDNYMLSIQLAMGGADSKSAIKIGNVIIETLTTLSNYFS